MAALSIAARLDRAFFATLADWLAVGVALALPWSTSAAGIFIAVWLVVLLPTLDPAAVKREIGTAAGGLPVLLWCLAVAGMLWADVDWTARFGGLDGFNRLLIIPVLFAQFRHSEHGGRVLCAFFISSATVLAASFFMVLTPNIDWDHHVTGIPVHDENFQSTDFAICAFGALGYAIMGTGRRHWRASLALIAVGALFLVNFTVAVVSRTAFVVVPVLAVLLGWRLYRWKGIAGAGIAIAVVAAASWLVSPSLRTRVNNSMQEIAEYRASGAGTSIGEHIAFVQEALAIVGSAPIIGQGTGSIPDQFRRITAGKTGAAGEATVNPHNQTLGVAIQLGLLGALVLWAMWIAHLLLFRGAGVAAWLGTVVVVENIVSSAAHSHLFDYVHGWLYVFAVGVLGGMVRRRALPSVRDAAPRPRLQHGGSSARLSRRR